MTATAATADAGFIDDGLARRNARLLAGAQALGGANASIIFLTAPLVGSSLLGADKSLATLPVSFFVLGIAFGTIPAGAIMHRFGRRVGFTAAFLFSALCSLLAAVAVFRASFPLLCVAILGQGLVGAFAQQFRFAAADTASEGFKPKAISWVLAGGVLAGVVGPQTVIYTKDLFDPILFAGTYIAQAGLALVCCAILSFIRVPNRESGPVAVKGRPLKEIFAQRRFIVAAACGVVSYSLMTFVMTATPLAMVGCGLSTEDAALGIQWHVIAMYGPSFFTGSLIARFGKERIVSIGLALLSGCAIVALNGVDVAHFWTALVLLGVGWNFGFIGATAMLTDTYRPNERTRVQSANDFLVFGFVAAASFSSGKILHIFGWETVNWIVIPFSAAALLLLGWLVLAERRTVAS
ncbi:MFS transporter [Stappia sp. F7233]|uniref:MFS transporter n=1 Tax=Stappia albiluteola TaxID=2758565 RepID=A0A839ADG3_9HYPH|nr:MFS transporter [Stappia albiluteola]MBA5776867.1 MFS transporter [Stappia albiluteola]